MSLTLANLERRMQALVDSQNNQANLHLTISQKETIIHAGNAKKVYVPTATGKFFHDDDSFVRLIMGPYGSGKSTLCVNEIIKRTCSMPRWSRGRRRARWAIVRNTSGELQSTTLQTWLQWFGELGDIHRRQKPLLTYEHRFNDGLGVVELELIFIALDRPDDVKKVKSLEVSGVYLNELSELPQNALSHFKGRVGRYPGVNFCKDPYWAGVIADSNPPAEDHYINKDFEVNQIEGYKVFHQPPGLIKNDKGIWETNPNADNIKNLPRGYYEKLASGQTEDFVKVFCLGNYGLVSLGKVVFPDYNPDLHAVDNISAIQGDPLYVSFDFGLTPTCLVCQITARGQLLVLKEYTSENLGLRSFVQSIVLPGIARDFPYNKIGVSVCDPSGAAKDTIMDELSCLGELNELGIKTNPARTNQLEPRIAAVRFFLNTLIEKKPAFQLSKKGCPVLHKALARDYVYRRMAVAGEERYRDIPDKNFASHVSDCLQYICLELAANSIANRQNENKPAINMFNPILRIF